MIRYEVRLDAEPQLADRLERYMRMRHIPEILATGCFLAIRFDRSGGARFRTSYTAGSRGELDRYLAEHAPALRADFLGHFPRGVQVDREIWEELEFWSAPRR